ncbi:MAG: cytochrome ubiquinol oxidase subunit I, partial [Bacteroidales bacterium]|nr:cytochrome ubiquinol oxidase subunit I [Bacteroidales bacterium]
RSILIAGIFGLLSSLVVVYTGDRTARTIATVQPVKFAAFEALYDGTQDAGLVTIGLLKDSDKQIGQKKIKEFLFKIEIPGFLSVMTGGDRNAFVPGINDLVSGNPSRGILSVNEKKARGQVARNLLLDYKDARITNDTQQIETIKAIFRDKKFNDDYFSYFGYASLQRPEDAIPSVTVSFYTFHLMVMLGFFFILVFILALFLLFRGTIAKNRWFLWIALFSIPLPYVAGELGWVLAEMGRQPWIIQDLMPVSSAVTQINAGAVITTFILFALLFTVLLIAEVSIMVKQIKIGPKH